MARAISGKKNCSSGRGFLGPPSGPIDTSAQTESRARTRSNSSRSANTHPSIGAETVSSPNESVKRANLNRKASTGQTSAQPSSSGASDRMARLTNRDLAQNGKNCSFLRTGIAPKGRPGILGKKRLLPIWLIRLYIRFELEPNQMCLAMRTKKREKLFFANSFILVGKIQPHQLVLAKRSLPHLRNKAPLRVLQRRRAL